MARDFYASGEILSSSNPTTSNTHHHQDHHHDHHHDHQYEMGNQIQSFHDDTNNHHQIFGLSTNMALIGFSKQQQHHNHHNHHHHSMTSGFDETSGGENMILEDSSSSMRCSNGNFSCEVEEEEPRIRSSQGLSLSLSSSNPTIINTSRQGYFGKPHNLQQTQMMMMMMRNNNSSNDHHYHNHQFQILSSKYLVPAQELLNEFCSLGIKQRDEEMMMMMMMKKNDQKGKQQQWNSNDNGNDHHHHHDKSASTSSRIEFMELQKRKTKLLSMLDEIDRRYHHYREQMRAAVAAFEAAAGVGAAETYTALAAKAMSRHFRCLRDSVVRQIQATKKAMGEREDPVAPGTTRGETPRLRLLDQAFRNQKVYRQMSLVDAHPWRPQRGLPERAVTILRAWLFEHFLNPYPSDVDKHILARQTGLSRSQVSNWFINARVRLWKPMIEEMYSEETKGEETIVNPTHMIRVDPDSLSSIITNPKPSQPHDHHQGTTSFGSTFDFSLYGHQALTFTSDSSNQDRTRGVSLTLGLQRHDASGGVSLAFSPPAAQGPSLFYGRDHMEDCEQGSVQYSTSLLDGY